MFMHGSTLHQNQTCVGVTGPVYLGPDQTNFEQNGNLIVELSTTLRVLEEKALLSTDKTPIQIIVPRMGVEGTLNQGSFFKQTETGTLSADFTALLPKTDCMKFQNVKYSSFELYLPTHEHQDIPAIVTASLATTDGQVATTTLGLQLTHDL